MKLIINADDFGLVKSKTDAIVEAFNKHFISDTTMVTNTEYFDYALELIKQNNIEDRIGIHFNLTKGEPLTEDIKKYKYFTKNVNRYRILSSNEKDAIYKELTAQIEKLEKAGIKVNHADSHHHIHTAFNIAPIVLRVCKEHNVNKIRLHRNVGHINILKKVGKNFYNKVLLKDFVTTKYFGALCDVDKCGLYDNLEIMVHPDFSEDGLLIDRTYEYYGVDTNRELALPKGDIELISYKDL